MARQLTLSTALVASAAAAIAALLMLGSAESDGPTREDRRRAEAAADAALQSLPVPEGAVTLAGRPRGWPQFEMTLGPFDPELRRTAWWSTKLTQEQVADFLTERTPEGMVHPSFEKVIAGNGPRWPDSTEYEAAGVSDSYTRLAVLVQFQQLGDHTVLRADTFLEARPLDAEPSARSSWFSLVALLAATLTTVILGYAVATPYRRRLRRDGAIEALLRLAAGTQPGVPEDWFRATITPGSGNLQVQGFGPGGLRFGRPAAITIEVDSAYVLERSRLERTRRSLSERLFCLVQVHTPTGILHARVLRRDGQKLEQVRPATAAPPSAWL